MVGGPAPTRSARARCITGAKCEPATKKLATRQVFHYATLCAKGCKTHTTSKHSAVRTWVAPTGRCRWKVPQLRPHTPRTRHSQQQMQALTTGLTHNAERHRDAKSVRKGAEYSAAAAGAQDTPLASWLAPKQRPVRQGQEQQRGMWCCPWWVECSWQMPFASHLISFVYFQPQPPWKHAQTLKATLRFSQLTLFTRALALETDYCSLTHRTSSPHTNYWNTKGSSTKLGPMWSQSS